MPRILGDIQSPRLMYAKAVLFVMLGIGSIVAVWLLTRDWRVLIVCLIAVWAFARAYYFAFYVIQHYIDPAYRFDGLFSVGRYLLTKRP